MFYSRRSGRTASPSLLVFIMLIWLLTGCGGQPEPTPAAVVAEPPTISEPKISAPTPQEPGQEIGISVDVSSASGVSLVYEWQADGGDIVRGDGSPAITYRTPDEPGIYNVRVTVKWDTSSVEKVTTIRVEAPVPDTPTPEPPTDTPTPKPDEPSPTATAPPPTSTLEPTVTRAPATETSAPVPSTAVNSGKRFGLVTNGEINDKGFNQLAWDGMIRADEELGVEVAYLESKQQADYDKNLNEFISQGYDGIITVGFLLADATKNASETHPEIPMAIVDFPSQTVGDMGLLFAVDEPSFLAGYLAAGMTKTGTVCTYGGMKISPVVQFMVGFEHGIKHYNARNGTQVKLLGWTTDFLFKGGGDGSFVGNFESFDDGRNFANNFFDDGCDIIFPVAGAVGLGSAAAAKDRGLTVIGVDADLTQFAPEYKEVYLTSVLKKVDVAVFSVIKQIHEGTFQGGENYLGTLQNGGVGLAPFHDYEDKVSQELRDELRDIRSGIISGEVLTGWRP